MRIYLTLLLYILSGVCLGASAQIITTVAGNGSAGYYGNGNPATTATLDSPTCIAIDGSGNLYINDQRNSCIRKVSPAVGGNIVTVAGTGVAGYNGDGGPASAAKLSLNWGMTVDRTGNIYIADQLNYRIRKVNTAGIISTVAGNGSAGYSGDNGPATAAKIQSPLGVAIDAFGNLFVGDPNNFCIRKVDAAGIITTYGGNGHYGYSGDGGPATNAMLSYTWGLATDANGNLYICDGANNRVRKISTSGIISTVAGTGAPAFSGDGGPAVNAELNNPLGVFVSSSNDIYISDCHNNRVRKIDNSGIINTIAGSGVPGYNGDGIPAILARFYHPLGIAMDASNNIFVADLDNVRVRMISNGRILSFTGGANQHYSVCENSVSAINTLLGITDYSVGLTDSWALTSPARHGTVMAAYYSTSTGGSFIPSGLTYTPDMNYSGPDTFQVKVSNGIAADSTTIYLDVVPRITDAGTITGDTNICLGSTIILSDNITGGVWTSGDGSGIVNADRISGGITGLGTGRATISYTVSNSCGAVTVTKMVTVQPLPNTGTISGPSGVCIGSSASFTNGVSGGSWSSTNNAISLLPSGFGTALVTGLLAGTDTIYYSCSNAWCRSSAMHIIVVDTFPDAGHITGADRLCIGSTVQLADSISGGIWSATNANASIVAGLVTGIMAGNDTIYYSFTNSCGSAQVHHPILIDALPAQPVITERAGILTAADSYYSYQWWYNNGAVPGGTHHTMSADKAGEYKVTVTSKEGCEATSDAILRERCSPDDMIVYPNPVTAKVYVLWCAPVTLRLICADGRSMLPIANTNELDISALPPATYFLEIFDSSGHKIKTKKLTKL